MNRKKMTVSPGWVQHKMITAQTSKIYLHVLNMSQKDKWYFIMYVSLTF